MMQGARLEARLEAGVVARPAPPAMVRVGRSVGASAGAAVPMVRAAAGEPPAAPIPARRRPDWPMDPADGQALTEHDA